MRPKSLSLLLLLFLLPVSLGAQSSQDPKDKVWLGITAEEGDAQHPVTLVEVRPGGPGYLAGLRVGDELLQVDKSKVKSLDGFIDTLRSMKPGETPTFSIRRKGKAMRLRVRLGSQAERNALAKAKSAAKGARLAQLDRPKRDRPRGKGVLGVSLEEDGQTTTITRVDKGSAAQKAGLEAGDVIVKAQGREVVDLEAFVRQIQKAGAGSNFKLEIRRRGQTKVIAARLGGTPGNQLANPGRMAPPARSAKKSGKKIKRKAKKKPANKRVIPSSEKVRKVVAQAKKMGRLALIIFFDPESPVSKLTSKSLADPKVRGILKTGYVGTRINVLTESRVADEYGVMATPHYLVLNGDGRVVGKFTGYQPAARLSVRFNRYLEASRLKSAAPRRATSRPAVRDTQKPRRVQAKPSAASEAQRNQRLLRQMQNERRRMEKLLKQMRDLEKKLERLKKGK